MIGTTYQQILDLLTNNPGNLLYHVILAFTIFGALQAALNLWRDDQLSKSRRIVLGLGLLLGIRLLLFISAGLVSLGLIDAHVLLPNADRAVMALSLVIIIWLWAFPEPTHLADSSSGFLALFVLTAFFITQLWWGPNHRDSTFNNTSLNMGWEIFAILLLSLSFVLLLIRKRDGWGYGLAMVGTLLLGHLTQLLYPDWSSDYPGAVRLFEIAAFPLLWSIPNQIAVQMTKEIESDGHFSPLDESIQPRIEPNIFQSLLSLTDKSSPETTYQKLTKLLAETFLADFSFVFLPPDTKGQVLIPSGYDMIRDAYRSTLSIESEKIPTLVSAMDRSRPLRLSTDSKSPDTRNIAKTLNLAQTGHLLVAFIPSLLGSNPSLGVALLSPYSKQQWSRDDQAFLNKIAMSLGPLLQPAELVEAMNQELEESKKKLSAVEALLLETQSQKDDLQIELSSLGEKQTEERSEESNELLIKLKELHTTINQLELENTQIIVEPPIPGASSDDRLQLRQELKLALTEIAHLINLLSEVDQQGKVFQDINTRPEPLFVCKNEAFTSIVQDLRRPMSTIVGYTELLLTESAGILGSLQRKFLARVKLSTERMDELLDELYQVGTLEIGELKLNTIEVEMERVINDAIDITKTQVQERGISIRIDLLEEMPRLIADPKAIEQIVINLLQNAGTATPDDGEVFIQASIYQTAEMQNFLLLQISDQGGGISKEELPNVFSSIHRSEEDKIQGLGETGIGLSVIKGLVEAHNGRVWVDTEMGKGSTFSLLLPIPQISEPDFKSETRDDTPS